MQNQSNVKINGMPNTAGVMGSILSEVSHVIQGMKKSSEEKGALIERYQRTYNIEYKMKDGKPEICSVDGNTDVEDTYSEEFLNSITYKIEDLEKSESKDNDEEYDDKFQNGE